MNLILSYLIPVNVLNSTVLDQLEDEKADIGCREPSDLSEVCEVVMKIIMYKDNVNVYEKGCDEFV